MRVRRLRSMVIVAAFAAMAAPASVLAEPFETHGAFWHLIELDVTAESNLTWHAEWFFEPPSGDWNLTQGGYMAHQWHLWDPTGQTATFLLLETRCGVMIHAVLGDAHRIQAGAEPPCPFLGERTQHSSVQFFFDEPGKHTVIVAAAGDFLGRTLSQFVASEGASIVRLESGSSCHLVTLEDFEGEHVSVFPAARWASSAWTDIAIEHSMVGIFLTGGQVAVGNVEVDGPSDYSGSTRYYFLPEGSGVWTFRVSSYVALGVNFVMVFVLDVPL